MGAKSTGLLALCGLLLVALVVNAPAQQDERLKGLIDKAEALLTQKANVFIRTYQTFTVNGQSQGESVQEVWVRDFEHLRAEKADGTIFTLTPEEVKLLHGPSHVVLLVPKETLEKLGKDREHALAQLGIGLPSALFRALVDSRDKLSITGQQTIGDEACWAVSVAEESLPAFGAALGASNPQMHLTAVEIVLGKESAALRAANFDMAGAARVEVRQTVPDIQTDVEVTDQMLTFATPEGATVIEWTPDQKPEEVAQRFRQAVLAATKPGP